MTKVYVHAPFDSDIGKSIISISEDLMRELDLKDGDFIYITKAKIQLIAKAKLMFSGDKYSIRLDFSFLKALHITFGQSVEIVKAS